MRKSEHTVSGTVSTFFRIEKVRAYRQWNRIDILVEVNDDSVIIIEDKTVTGTHSDQLQRYREKVEEIFGGKTIYCIYLKTGNESVFDLSKNVEAYGYRVVGRGDILEILNSCKTSNDILTEFRENTGRAAGCRSGMRRLSRMGICFQSEGRLSRIVVFLAAGGRGRRELAVYSD